MQPRSRDENPSVTKSESSGVFGSKCQWGVEDQGMRREVNGIWVDRGDDLGFIAEHYTPGDFLLGKREKGEKDF